MGTAERFLQRRQPVFPQRSTGQRREVVGDEELVRYAARLTEFAPPTWQPGSITHRCLWQPAASQDQPHASRF
jgi:hypothetical protein